MPCRLSSHFMPWAYSPCSSGDQSAGLIVASELAIKARLVEMKVTTPLPVWSSVFQAAAAPF